MTPEERIAKLEAERAERKSALERQRIQQYSLDLEALNAAELEHGDSSVDRLELPFTPGLPGMVIVRCPNRTEIKVYRSRLTEGKKPDTAKAAAELGRRCIVYPDQSTDAGKELFERMLDARPGIDAQAGIRAVQLSVAKANAEGED